MTNLRTFIGLALAAISGSAFAALITVVPSSSRVNVGDSFFLTVHGEGFPETAGSTLGLSFDSGVVAFNSVALAPGSPFTGGVSICIGSSCLGGAAISVLAPFTAPPDPSGSFDAYQIDFTALAAGSANIRLVDSGVEFGWVDSNDPGFNLLRNVAYSQATVDVAPRPTAVAEPSTISLILIGLLGLLASPRIRHHRESGASLA